MNKILMMKGIEKLLQKRATIARKSRKGTNQNGQQKASTKVHCVYDINS